MCNIYEISKTKELKIDNTLWVTSSKSANLLDFNPDKINIKTDHANDIKVHYVRYESGGFYLTIDDLDGYFYVSHNLRHLSLLFDGDDKQNKYCQVWNKILKTINGGHGEINKCKEIRIFDDDLPIGDMFKINSITIAIESLIEKDIIFYQEIALNHCSYEI